ncbi:MAG: ABC transporter permease [Pseudomonadota bacterium]
MLREMATSYGRSPGGYLWAIGEPIAAIALMTYVFSYVFEAPVLGRNFALFYATGYLPFMLFHDVAAKVGTAVRFSRPLLAYPAVAVTDALIARWVLNVMTHLAVFLIVMTGIELSQDTGAIYDAGAMINALAMAALLAAGVGTLNAWLMPRLPAWERLWAILSRPLFIVSGVFFVFENLPPALQDIAWYNPLFHVTGEMRRAVYPAYEGAYVSSGWAYGFALTCLIVGLMLIRTGKRDILHS